MNRLTLNCLLAGLLVVSTTCGALAQSMRGLGGLPLFFTAQKGHDGTPCFLATGPDTAVLISPAMVQFDRCHQSPIQAQLVGANPLAAIRGEVELDGKVNFLRGNDGTQWRANVPTFDHVRVDNLYPGVAAVYHGNQQRLEYDYQVAPGINPAVIQLRFSGTDKIAVNPAGELELFAGAGQIRQPKPEIYQTIAGVRHNISGGFRLVDDRTVAFTIGDYDRSQPLVIDPILYYSTYFGGTAGDSALAVAVNTNDGSFFVAGQTLSGSVFAGGPFSTTNAFQKTFQGGSVYGDAFVAKFDKHFNLVYLTYLGGGADDTATAIAVDGLGHAFVGGYTDSANFPVTNRIHGLVGVPGLTNHISGPINQYTGGYMLDGFVTELETNGSSLVWSTFIGGNAEDSVLALAIDDVDNVYVTGYTLSTNFPCTNAIPFKLAGGYTNQYLNYLACPYTYYNYNGFVAEIASQGASLLFSSYLGGTNLDAGTGIAVDRAHNIFVSGYTASTNFPNTNAFQKYLNQSTNNLSTQYSYTFNVFDAFVTKIAPGPGHYQLLYSTFLGSTNSEQAHGIRVDDTGAYVTGYTASSNYYNTRIPVIFSGVTNNLNGGYYITNVFLTKITTTNLLNANASSIAWSVVFGGFSRDVGTGLALDPKGDIFVVGTMFSGNFPTTNGFGLLATNKVSPGTEVFVTAFAPDCTRVLYSVLLGVNNNNYGYAIDADQNGTVYLSGQTYSKNFPCTTAIPNVPGLGIQTAWAPGLGGISDGIIAAIGLNPDPYEPSLAITRTTAKTVTLSWPYNYQLEPYASKFILESATNLLATSISLTNFFKTNNVVLGDYWVPVLTPVSLTTTSSFVLLPSTNSARFFRLSNTNSAY